MIINKDGNLYNTSNDFVIKQLLKYGGVEVKEEKAEIKEEVKEVKKPIKK